MDESFDYHVHIGQWKDRYFSAKSVFEYLQKQGKSGCNFMSTTSCAPLHPDNKTEILSLYETVQREIKEALQTAINLQFEAHAFYWVVPLFHLSGINLEHVFSELPEYKGLKIHPLSHNWNPENLERAELLNQVFDFADKNNLPIILHTGLSPVDTPCRFEKWYKNYPGVKVTLAHCKNLPEVKYLFDKYPQLNGDISFIPQENLEYLLQNDYEDRLVYGSDYPISTIKF